MNHFILRYSPLISRTCRTFQTSELRLHGTQPIRLVEVGPRDGLQNEKTILPKNIKINLIDKLSRTGLQWIEASSFVHPKWVPQLADSMEVFTGITRQKDVKYMALVPNKMGLLRAIKADVRNIAIFTAATETFCKRNINCTIDESMQRFDDILEIAKSKGLYVRAYISCVVGCPYENSVSPDAVARLVKQLWDKGCHEISLGDTIGVGIPESIDKLLSTVLVRCGSCPAEAVAIHCHDTNGNALANISVAVDQYNVRIVDSSISGLGGCPYAGPNATGNVSTEILVPYLLSRGYKFTKELDAAKLTEIGQWIRSEISKVKQAI